jgi:hypothetical protein
LAAEGSQKPEAFAKAMAAEESQWKRKKYYKLPSIVYTEPN